MWVSYLAFLHKIVISKAPFFLFFISQKKLLVLHDRRVIIIKRCWILRVNQQIFCIRMRCFSWSVVPLQFLKHIFSDFWIVSMCFCLIKHIAVLAFLLEETTCLSAYYFFLTKSQSFLEFWYRLGTESFWRLVFFHNSEILFLSLFVGLMRGGLFFLRFYLLYKLTWFSTCCLARIFAGIRPLSDGKVGAEASTWRVYEHISHLIKVHGVDIRQLLLDPSTLVHKVSKFCLYLGRKIPSRKLLQTT